jgi:hypothetical protein
MRALLLMIALAGCNKEPAGPPCTTPIPSTKLFEVYCDVQNRVFCLAPEYQDI